MVGERRGRLTLTSSISAMIPDYNMRCAIHNQFILDVCVDQ
jgi:hypothetical protein